MLSQDLKQYGQLKVEDKFIELNCSIEHFVDALKVVREHFEYIWLIDIVVIDNKKSSFRIEYILKVFEENIDISLISDFVVSDTLSSLGDAWGNAAALEQEISEMFGVKFSNSYENRIFGNENTVFPLLKEQNNLDNIIERTEPCKFDFNLTLKNKRHQAGLKFNLDLDENEVVHSHVTSGLWHVGIEKIAEKSDVSSLYSLFETYFSFQGVEWSTCLSRNLEKNLDIVIPERAMALRMVILEFSRIQGHLNTMINLSYELEHPGLYEKSLLWRQQVQNLIIRFTGNEYGHNLTRFGGVIRDVPQVWTSEVIQTLATLEKTILSEYKNITNSEQWKNALSFDLLNKADAMKWSVSGPLLRATGVNLDYRKTDPIYYYEDVDFDVPVGVFGRGFDVLLIRFEEIFQSIKIISQVLDNLPTGSIMSQSINSFYSLKDDFNFSVDDYKNTVINLYDIHSVSSSAFLEGANGLLGLSHSINDGVTNRLKLTSQSFFQKYLFEKITIGCDVENILPFWTLLNIHLKEAER